MSAPMRTAFGIAIIALFWATMDVDARGIAKRPAEPVMVTVHSSALRAIGYAGQRRILDVELQNGRRYRYFRVPAKVAHAFLASPSKGRYYNQLIKPAFRFQQLP